MSREILYRGKRKDNDEWICGWYAPLVCNDKTIIPYIRNENGTDKEVIPETVGEFTGITEFDTKDETVGMKIFECDIVEIKIPRDVYGRKQSQYDSILNVRGVVKQERARWFIDLENDYNKSLFSAKGKEAYDRSIPNFYFVDDFYLSETQKKFSREHNSNSRRNYIKVIGNIFDNPELLEVKQ